MITFPFVRSRLKRGTSASTSQLHACDDDSEPLAKVPKEMALNRRWSTYNGKELAQLLNVYRASASFSEDNQESSDTQHRLTAKAVREVKAYTAHHIETMVDSAFLCRELVDTVVKEEKIYRNYNALINRWNFHALAEKWRAEEAAKEQETEEEMPLDASSGNSSSGSETETGDESDLETESQLELRLDLERIGREVNAEFERKRVAVIETEFSDLESFVNSERERLRTEAKITPSVPKKVGFRSTDDIFEIHKESRELSDANQGLEQYITNGNDSVINPNLDITDNNQLYTGAFPNNHLGINHREEMDSSTPI